MKLLFFNARIESLAVEFFKPCLSSNDWTLQITSESNELKPPESPVDGLNVSELGAPPATRIISRGGGYANSTHRMLILRIDYRRFLLQKKKMFFLFCR